MKKLICLFLICLLGASIALAGPKVVVGTWTSDSGQVKTNYWTEAFVGGGPGQVGNVLTAQGTGFKLTDAAISEPPVCGPVGGSPPYLPCTTKYDGGKLHLDAGGPWLKSGNVTIPVSAINTSKTYLSGGGAPTGELEFSITLTGQFQVGVTTYQIEVVASWGKGVPETRVQEGRIVIQRGTDFDCVVTITQI
jgi:hypothetical protein